MKALKDRSGRKRRQPKNAIRAMLDLFKADAKKQPVSPGKFQRITT